MGFDLATEADEFLNDGQCEKAIPLYEEAIAIARKPALALHQQQQQQQHQQQLIQEKEDDYDNYDVTTDQQILTEALQWIIRLYCNSANAYLKIRNLDQARRSAMAACVYSQNSDLTSLTIFADVCQASGDLINQVQTVKRILELLMEMEVEMEEEGSNDDEFVIKKERMMSRLKQLEQDLQDTIQ